MTKNEALKLALEALEELNKLSIGEHAICLPAEIDTAMDAIREVLAQPEQEPVATVAEVHMSRYTIEWTNGPLSEGTPLYTTPPQRKPLTDEEIAKLADDFLDYQIEDYQVSGVFNFARAIEAAHGIKE